MNRSPKTRCCLQDDKASPTREAHLVHASVAPPLGPRGEDAADGGWRGGGEWREPRCGFFFFLLTVRVLFCFRQIQRRWPICASRIRGSLCLKMFHHFMGIENKCGRGEERAPTWLLRRHKASRETAKPLGHPSNNRPDMQKLTLGSARQRSCNIWYTNDKLSENMTSTRVHLRCRPSVTHSLICSSFCIKTCTWGFAIIYIRFSTLHIYLNMTLNFEMNMKCVVIDMET